MNYIYLSELIMLKTTSIAISVFVFILIFMGCSRNQNPLVSNDFIPSDGSSDIASIPDIIQGPLSSGTIHFNLDSLSASVIPDRSSDNHLNVSMKVPYPVVNIISYDPTTQIVEADVKIKNTRPIDVYDVRLIIFNDNNETELLNPDGWTGIWDIPGGNVINPFMAYAKSSPNRKFAGLSEYTERLKIYIPAGVPSVRWAIDANYPGNCSDAYSIENIYQATLYDYQDAVTTLYADVYDWQWDVTEVVLHAPEVTNELLSYFLPVDSVRWKLNLTNRKAVPEGEYPGVIRATSMGPDSHYLYQYITIKVTAYHPAKWTIFYYAYEENLYGVRDNINEMEVVGSADGLMNMVALWDETGTVEDHIMRIQKDPGGMNNEIITPSIDDHHEVIPPDGLNMRDPDTVTRFLRYAMREFPAENYGFIMLSHGNGGVYTFPPDKNFLDDMGVWEFREAAKIALDENPFVHKLEFIGLESCTMSFLEWAYGMKDLAKIGWASEFVMWLSSARYDQVLNEFLANIDTYTGYDFATLYVNNTVDTGGAVTYGAWESDHVDPIVIPALNSFAQSLIDYLPTYRIEIESCRAGSDNWGNECTDFRITDLGYFCENIINYNPPLPGDLTSKAALLRQAIADSFFVRRVKNPGAGCYHAATGWQILFTDQFRNPSDDYADVRNRIQKIGFADATLWDEFLALYDDNNY